MILINGFLFIIAAEYRGTKVRLFKKKNVTESRRWLNFLLIPCFRISYTKVAIKRAVKVKRGSTRGGSKFSKGGGQRRRITDAGGSTGMVDSIPDSADPEIGVEDPPSDSSESVGKSKSMTASHNYSLGFLASAFGRRDRMSWLPWKKNGDNHSRFNQAIFGSTASISTKTLAARMCPFFNEQARRENEFITEMRTLSRLRHPCITTVSKYQPRTFEVPP